MIEHVKSILIMVLVSFLIVVCAIPIIKMIAKHVGAIDVPRHDDENRHIHKVPIPKLGGLGVYFGFLVSYMIFGTPSLTMNSILIGSFIIIITGFIDDIKPLSALAKFTGQVIAALIIVFYGHLLISEISAFGITLRFGVLAYPLTLFFILGSVNCINLIDGLDGLSSGISSIYFLTIGIIAVMQNKFGLDCTLAFILLGSTLGFLLYNFNPASMFIGDTGSMFLGFMIAVIALLGFKNVTMTSLLIPLLLIAIPILDTLFAIIRRKLKGQSISHADKLHIHHQLLSRNLSQRTTVLVIYLIDALFAFASIVYFLHDRVLGYIVYGALIIIVLIFVLKTNVVFDHSILDDIKKSTKKK